MASLSNAAELRVEVERIRRELALRETPAGSAASAPEETVEIEWDASERQVRAVTKRSIAEKLAGAITGKFHTGGVVPSGSLLRQATSAHDVAVQAWAGLMAKRKGAVPLLAVNQDGSYGELLGLVGINVEDATGIFARVIIGRATGTGRFEHEIIDLRIRRWGPVAALIWEGIGSGMRPENLLWFKTPRPDEVKAWGRVAAGLTDQMSGENPTHMVVDEIEGEPVPEQPPIASEGW